MRDSLQHAMTEFTQWRLNKTGRGVIPTDLWKLAGDCLAEHDLGTVARVLGVPKNRLYEKTKTKSLETRAKPAQRPSDGPDVVPFPSIAPRTSEFPNQAIFELTSPDGTQIKILRGASPADISALLLALKGQV